MRNLKAWQSMDALAAEAKFKAMKASSPSFSLSSMRERDRVVKKIAKHIGGQHLVSYFMRLHRDSEIPQLRSVIDDDKASAFHKRKINFRLFNNSSLLFFPFARTLLAQIYRSIELRPAGVGFGKYLIRSVLLNLFNLQTSMVNFSMNFDAFLQIFSRQKG